MISSKSLESFSHLGEIIEAEKGPFKLYALLERDDNPGKWDMVMAAPWITSGTFEETKYVIEKMTKHLSKQEKESVSVVILLPTDADTVNTILDVYRTDIRYKFGIEQYPLQHVYINGMLIVEGWILAAPSLGSVDKPMRKAQ